MITNCITLQSGDRLNRFRPLILSLVLAAVAFGLTRLNVALQASPPVVSAASGAVLFASAFDDAEAEWETSEGRLSSKVGGGSSKSTSARKILPPMCRHVGTSPTSICE